MALNVTRVELSTAAPGPLDPPGVTLWRVEWTDKLGDHAQGHYTEPAANGHVANLLADRKPGLNIADIFTDHTE